VSTQRQLIDRWQTPLGKGIQDRIYSLCLFRADHGHSADDLFQLLNGLPYREEVENGRDLRGLSMGASDMDLTGTNFAYGSMSSFFHCKLINCVFDGCRGERASFHDDVTSSSFVRAKLRACYFDESIATKCDFSSARLRGSYFQKTDLRGSRFVDADCRGCSFAGANLLGCDFRGANLEQAVFCDVILDKSTDFRGANLSRTIDTDWHDNHGNIVRRGTDLSQATL
jgi:uncharacterized protein YjbI with pentapeptide repeats